MRAWVGADPGVRGAVAACCEDGSWRVLRFASLETSLLQALAAWFDGVTPVLCVAERVTAWPTMSRVAAFKLGESCGRLFAALEALRVPVAMVRPADWQRTLGCLTHGDKRVSVTRACALIPGVAWTAETADAGLLAWYARERWCAMRGLGCDPGCPTAGQEGG